MQTSVLQMSRVRYTEFIRKIFTPDERAEGDSKFKRQYLMYSKVV